MKQLILFSFILLNSCCQNKNEHNVSLEKIISHKPVYVYDYYYLSDGIDSAKKINRFLPLQVYSHYLDSLKLFPFVSALNENMSFNYSFVSDYKNALLYADSANIEKIGKINPLSKSLNNINFDSIVCKSAANYIIKEASNHSIIMFNERHYNSYNRVFVSSLLDSLKLLGYNYLFCETLNPFYFKKYPNSKNIERRTGYYTQEPEFANMLRHAIDLGYTILAYEDTMQNDFNRDINQAQSIYNQIKSDSNAKIIIYAGYGHVREYGNTCGITMGEELIRLTKQNPLTIDQVEYVEASNHNLESFLYSCIIDNFRFKTPQVVYFNNSDKPMCGSKVMDASIYFPRIEYLNKRPTFLQILDRKQISFPLVENAVFVQAYLAADFILINENNLIPVDQTYYESNFNYFLCLPKGDYYIVYRDVDYNIIKTKKFSHH